MRAFFDDSEHRDADFVLGALVICRDDPGPEITEALRTVGLQPGVDEYKSGYSVLRRPELQDVRDRLWELLSTCRVAVVVVPHTERSELGWRGLLALKGAGEHLDEFPEQVWFDEGCFASESKGLHAARRLGLDTTSLVLEADSRKVLGLQLADLAAHTAAVALRWELGLQLKEVHCKHVEDDVPLGMEMWNRLRRQLLGDQSEEDPETMHTYRRGLYYSRGCSERVANAAHAVFDNIYLHCIM